MKPKTADEILKSLGILKPEHINLDVIAKSLNATIEMEPLDGLEGKIVGFDGTAIITVNSRSLEQRKRFSIAHELGHWVHDQGTTFNCKESDLIQWTPFNKETVANNFAASLLLPTSMFVPISKNLPPTYENIKKLKETFSTSIFATAIRLVQTTQFPCMLVFTEGNSRKWFIKSKSLPNELFPHEHLITNQNLKNLLNGGQTFNELLEVDASDWINHKNSYNYTLFEQSMNCGTNKALSLLWWKDEGQIFDLLDHEDEDDYE